MVLEVGTPAPEFTLEGIDGGTYSLQEALARGPTLLVFWKTNCGAVELALPYINRLADSYDDRWQLWAIAQEPLERAQEYAKERAMKYLVLLDTPGYGVSKRYDPPATPAFFLIDADGRVAFASHGFSKDTMNELSRLVAARLGREPKVVAPPDDGQPAFRPG